MDRNTHNKVSLHVFFSGLVIGLVTFAFTASGAAVWVGPANEPPIVGSIGSIIDIDDLLDVTINTKQEVQGQLGLSYNGYFPVFLGRDATVNAPAIGVAAFGIADAGATYDPDLSAHDELGPTIGSTHVGLLGYATGGTTNYGIYTVTDTGTALGARAAGGAPSYGAWFSGNVSIEDNPESTADGTLTYPGTLVAEGNVAVQKALGASVTGSASTGTGKTGIYGVSQTVPLGSGIGVHGQSTNEDGVELTIADESIGMYALSTDLIGLYGYSVSGAGIFGTADSSGLLGVGVYGTAEDFGVFATSTYHLVGNEYQNGSGYGSAVNEETGVGIFACGTTYAGLFTGDINIQGALHMGIDDVTYIESSEVVIGKKVTPSVTLDKATIQAAFTQCVLDGGCTIP